MTIRDFDRQVVFQKGSGYDNGPIDYAASAKANLKAAGRDLVNIFDPTNHFRGSNDYHTSVPAAEGIMMFINVLAFPWRVAGEILDIPLGPVLALKDVTEAAVYGVLAGIQNLH